MLTAAVGAGKETIDNGYEIDKISQYKIRIYFSKMFLLKFEISPLIFQIFGLHKLDVICRS